MGQETKNGHLETPGLSGAVGDTPPRYVGPDGKEHPVLVLVLDEGTQHVQVHYDATRFRSFEYIGAILAMGAERVEDVRRAILTQATLNNMQKTAAAQKLANGLHLGR